MIVVHVPADGSKWPLETDIKDKTTSSGSRTVVLWYTRVKQNARHTEVHCRGQRFWTLCAPRPVCPTPNTFINTKVRGQGCIYFLAALFYCRQCLCFIQIKPKTRKTRRWSKNICMCNSNKMNNCSVSTSITYTFPGIVQCVFLSNQQIKTWHLYCKHRALAFTKYSIWILTCNIPVTTKSLSLDLNTHYVHRMVFNKKII